MKNAIHLNQAAWKPARLTLPTNINVLGSRLSAPYVAINFGIQTNNVIMGIYLGVEIAKFKLDILA